MTPKERESFEEILTAEINKLLGFLPGMVVNLSVDGTPRKGTILGWHGGTLFLGVFDPISVYAYGARPAGWLPPLPAWAGGWRAPVPSGTVPKGVTLDTLADVNGGPLVALRLAAYEAKHPTEGASPIPEDAEIDDEEREKDLPYDILHARIRLSGVVSWYSSWRRFDEVRAPFSEVAGRVLLDVVREGWEKEVCDVG